jgi:hypothetical protein
MLDGGSILTTPLGLLRIESPVRGVLGRSRPVARRTERRSESRTAHCRFFAR